MKITIICVGKIKEKFYRDALSEYTKRLTRYTSLSICEVDDEPTPDKCSDAQAKLIKEKEASRIQKNMNDNDYVIVLAIEGKMLDSVALSKQMDSLLLSGTSNITFVIGGSLGLSQSILDRADFQLSFSKMTFPHQLMRVILLEQIYRSFRISKNEPYHK